MLILFINKNYKQCILYTCLSILKYLLKKTKNDKLFFNFLIIRLFNYVVHSYFLGINNIIYVL